MQGDGEGLDATEKDIERALRPWSFDDFTGQQKVVEYIKVFVSGRVSEENH